MQARQLDALAEQLAPTFPGRSDAAVARPLLAALGLGRPVSVPQLARAAGLAEAVVRDRLSRWSNVEYDHHGSVIAFAGLSLKPTAHSLNVRGRELFAWCAWDTLFLPSLLDAPAAIRSTCRETGAPVELRADAAGVRDARPSELWVTFPDPGTATTTDIVTSFCCHVHFIAGTAAAASWEQAHHGGLVLDVENAYKLGVLATAALRS